MLGAESSSLDDGAAQTRACAPAEREYAPRAFDAQPRPSPTGKLLPHAVS